MNIFLREMKANRKSLIIWSVCLMVGVLSGMSKFTAYSEGSASNQALNELPRTFRALFGMGDFDVTKMSGFFAFLFLYIELAAAVHAVLLGSGILAKEERDKTTEFLAAKPVSRSEILTSKFLASLINLLVLNVSILVSSVILTPIYNKGQNINSEIILFMVSLFLVQLIFFSLGSFIAATANKPKGSGAVASGIMLGTFAISEITNLSDNLNALNILSPFKYFSYSGIAKGDGLNAWIVLLSILLIGLFILLTYLNYNKRDLKV